MKKKTKTKKPVSDKKTSDSRGEEKLSIENRPDHSDESGTSGEYGGMDLRNFKKNLGCGG